MKKIISIFAFLVFTNYLVACASMADNSKQKANLYFDIGANHLQSGNYPLALQNFLEAEKLNSSDARTQNALGLVYLFREKLDLSEKHFKRAISLNPKDTETRNNYAQLLVSQNRFAEAEVELEKSMKDLTYPSPEKSYYLMGFSKFNQEKYEEALGYFERSLKFKKDTCQTHNYYGRTLFEMKRYQDASTALDRAVGFCQSMLYDEPHYYSALAYYRLGHIGKSRARFQEVFQVYPEGQYRSKARAMLDMMERVQNQ